VFWEYSTNLIKEIGKDTKQKSNIIYAWRRKDMSWLFKNDKDWIKKEMNFSNKISSKMPSIVIITHFKSIQRMKLHFSTKESHSPIKINFMMQLSATTKSLRSIQRTNMLTGVGIWQLPNLRRAT
jgi:hypothetical protein